MRDDFPELVKQLLARRAGMRCSNPGCRRPTSGAAVEESKAINIGVAAHISAAAPGGPRYDKTISNEDRRSVKNGIWMCAKCATLIDRDELKYTSEFLLKWKANADRDAADSLEKGTNIDQLRSKYTLPEWLSVLNFTIEASNQFNTFSSRPFDELRRLLDLICSIRRKLNRQFLDVVCVDLDTEKTGVIRIIIQEELITIIDSVNWYMPPPGRPRDKYNWPKKDRYETLEATTFKWQRLLEQILADTGLGIRFQEITDGDILYPLLGFESKQDFENYLKPPIAAFIETADELTLLLLEHILKVGDTCESKLNRLGYSAQSVTGCFNVLANANAISMDIAHADLDDARIFITPVGAELLRNALANSNHRTGN